MELARRSLLTGCAASLLAAGCTRHAHDIRIGFIVKQPEEQWFQDEWRYAGQAATRYGFDLIRIGAPDGDRVLSAIDNLYAKYARGFIICAPDPRLGTAIRLRAEATDLKVMSVDDRLIGIDGKPIASIPHVGISARLIGEMAGREAVAEARRRGWDLGTTGLLRIAFDGLDTGRERTEGGVDAAVAGGLSRSNVFAGPQRTTDTEGGFTAADPVLVQHQAIKRWIILGLNDETVLGGVRASEGLGLAAADVIGVGVGGSGTAGAEFAKTRPTGFHASVLLSPRAHGYDTAAAMYDWIAHGHRPAALTYTLGTMVDRSNFRRLLAAEKPV